MDYVIEDAANDLAKPVSNPLTGIYRKVFACSYSCGEQAIVKIDNSCVIIRPWTWGDAKPDAAVYRGQIPEERHQAIQGWLAKEPDQVAEMTLGAFVFWTSRRIPFPRQDLEDGQTVGGKKFDRRLIREVAQTWIESCANPGKEWMLIETLTWPDPNGQGEDWAIRLSCAGIQSVIMGLRAEAVCGNDPLPAKWRNVQESAKTAVDSDSTVSESAAKIKLAEITRSLDAKTTVTGDSPVGEFVAKVKLADPGGP